MKRTLFILLYICTSIYIHAENDIKTQFSTNEYWKAGIASAKITPDSPIWMAGYATRTSPSEGILHDIYAKSIVLEDANGKKVILVTIDVLGIPKDVSDRIRNEIQRKFGIDKECVILNSSHTHSGPVLSEGLKYVYPMDTKHRLVVKKYTSWFEHKIIEVIERSMHNMQASKIYTSNGIARFQVNRRENVEKRLTNTTQLLGSIDYSVPVIKIENSEQKIIAIIFGYACHPTVLNINKISGDYPGFAQIELEKLYPGALAMFFQGTAGDLNPLPRRSLALAKKYGKELAAAVECVLTDSMTEQYPQVSVAYIEIDLHFGTPFTLDQLKEVSKETDFNGNWAKGMIDDVKSNIKFPTTYPYPIQLWKIGNQLLFSLGGEVVSSYGTKIKEMYGHDVFIMAYSNDVMGYIPSVKVIIEDECEPEDGHGYEGYIAQRVYGFHAVWDKRIEIDILNNIDLLFMKIDK